MKRISLFFYGVVLASFFSACKTQPGTSSAPAVDPAAGTWEYLVAGTPNGDYPGTFIIRKDGDTYAGEIGADGQFAPLRDVALENGNVLSFNFDFMGMYIQVKGELSGESFSGKTTVDYMDFPITANRKSQ